MALTDATRLADFSSGVGTDGTLSTNNINATGIVTASSFEGDGSATDWCKWICHCTYQVIKHQVY